MSDALDASRIPTVDLSALRRGDEAARERAAHAIREGFGTYGLVYLAGHGVDTALRDDLYERFARFTDSPPQRKEPLNRGDLWYQRGWTPPNSEKAVVAGGQPDFKECYFAAPMLTDPGCRLEYPQLYADNVWPSDDPAFREAYLTVGRQLHEAGAILLTGVERALDVEPGTLTRSIDGGPHVFRLLRYLALTAEQVGTDIVWGEEHTDFNLVTLLPGGRFLDPDGRPSSRPDDGSGLYLRTRPTDAHPRGQKVLGRAPEGCIVAQVGQQLEVLSGGALLATPHVITAPRTPGYTRVSGAHFIHLHSHAVVAPLPRFRTDDTIRAYGPPKLAGTYSIKTLVDIGLAPPHALDALGYAAYDRLSSWRREESSGPRV